MTANTPYSCFDSKREKFFRLYSEDIHEKDDLMCRFSELSYQERVEFCGQNNCYSWSVGDKSTILDFTPSAEREIRQISGLNPGDSKGCLLYPFLPQAYQRSLAAIWRICTRVDGLKPLRLVYGQPLPAVSPDAQLIALAMQELGKGVVSYHFIARGSSGYFSHIPGRGACPEFLESDGCLVTDPRKCKIDNHLFHSRFAFFTLPRAGLNLRLDGNLIESLTVALNPRDYWDLSRQQLNQHRASIQQALRERVGQYADYCQSTFT